MITIQSLNFCKLTNKKSGIKNCHFPVLILATSVLLCRLVIGIVIRLLQINAIKRCKRRDYCDSRCVMLGVFLHVTRLSLANIKAHTHTHTTYREDSKRLTSNY